MKRIGLAFCLLDFNIRKECQIKGAKEFPTLSRVYCKEELNNMKVKFEVYPLDNPLLMGDPKN